MKTKKSILTLMLVMMSAFCFTGDSTFPSYDIVDTYKMTMRLRVPRIYDNMQSLGYRRYQPQRFVGELSLIYRSTGDVDVQVNGLTNRTHRINGKFITYECSEWPYGDFQNMAIAVGNNRTLKFNQGGIDVAFVADPSYNIGGLEEDNTLMLRMSGMGSIGLTGLRSMRGSVTGRIGCGCSSYGHISPTRIWHSYVTGIVTDVAPVYGTFTLRFRKRTTKKADQ